MQGELPKMVVGACLCWSGYLLSEAPKWYLLHIASSIFWAAVVVVFFIFFPLLFLSPAPLAHILDYD